MVKKILRNVLCAMLIAAVMAPMGMVLAAPKTAAKAKATAKYGPGKIYKAKDLINLRSKPAYSEKNIIMTLKKGEAFTFISKYSARWYKVRTKYGKVGYVDTRFIKYDKSIAPKGLGPGKIYSITTDYLRLRKKANNTGDIIVKLRKGELVTSVGKAPKGWYKVRTKSGKTGYAASIFMKYKYTVAKK